MRLAILVDLVVMRLGGEMMAEVSFPLRLAGFDVLIVAEAGEVVLRGFGAKEIEMSAAEARTFGDTLLVAANAAGSTHDE